MGYGGYVAGGKSLEERLEGELHHRAFEDSSTLARICIIHRSIRITHGENIRAKTRHTSILLQMGGGDDVLIGLIQAAALCTSMRDDYCIVPLRGVTTSRLPRGHAERCDSFRLHNGPKVAGHVRKDPKDYLSASGTGIVNIACRHHREPNL